MAKSAKYWEDRAIRRLTDAEKQGELYSKRIRKMYDQANRNIQRDIENIYRNYSKATGLDTQSLKELLTASESEKLWAEMKRKGLDKYVKGNYKARITRLEKLQAQMYAKVKEIYPKELELHTEGYKGILSDSYNKAIYDTQMGTGYDFGFSQLDDNMVSALLDERWSGANYSKRIWGNTDLLAESVSEIIGGALLSGQSVEKTSRQIRERFGVGKYYADRLVRTEMNHFHNAADAMAYEEMGMDKYVYMAVLDTRTSDICQRLDNKVFELKERKEGVNYPPMHPNCRSTTRAYLGEDVEKTLKRRARNPITGENEVIDNMSYEDWAEQHDIDKPTMLNSKNKQAVGGSSVPKHLQNIPNSDTISESVYDFNTIPGEHTIESDLGTPQSPKVNPHFSQGGDYANNCGYCSAAFEMRRRGFDVEANPKSVMLVSDWEQMFEGFVPKVVLDADADRALASIIEDIESWGDGARGTVFGAWGGHRVGHFFNFEVIGGKCVFVDPQSGRYDVSYYFEDIDLASIVYGRTDNLEPSGLIKNACKNKG